jgi:hypothetical protein
MKGLFVFLSLSLSVFSIGQTSVPVVSDVVVSGHFSIYSTIKASYTFYYADSPSIENCTYQWYRADDVNKLNSVAISGDTNITHIIVIADLHKYLYIAITPTNASRSVWGITKYSTTQLCYAKYHVDYTNGNDSRDGLSESTSWKTISKVNSSMSSFAGSDSICFKRGEIFEGTTLWITKGGSSASSRITFTAYGSGALPILTHGTDGGIISDSKNTDHITISYLSINTIDGNNAGIAATSQNRYDWIIDHCNINGCANGIFISRANGIVIKNCIITNNRIGGIVFYGQTGQEFGVCNGTVDSCTIVGMGAILSTDGITVHVSDDNLTDAGDNWIFRNCDISNFKEQGIDIQCEHSAIGNVLIENNSIHNIYDGNMNLCIDNNSIIRYNNIYNGSKHGIYIGNRSKDVAIYYNVLSNNVHEDLTFTQTAGGSVSNINFYNNTIEGGAEKIRSSIRVMANSNLNRFDVKNNIFILESSYTCFIEYENGLTIASSNSSIDYNIYYNPAGVGNKFQNSSNKYLTFADWQSGTIVDAHSAFVNPLLNTDFTLKSGSPAFEVGTDVGLSFEGKYPNIGAYQNNLTFKRIQNNTPVINNQEFIIKETDNLNNSFGTVNASPEDPGQELNYQIILGNDLGFFSINKQTGEFFVTNINIFNYPLSEYTLAILVEDNGEMPKSNSALITIKLLHKQNTFYIDPTNQDLIQDGTIEHPFSAWSKILWENGCTYLQKKGTISNESKINISACQITMGSYGEGDLPIIQSNVKDFAIRVFEKNNILIKGLHIIANDAISCIYYLGESCDSITIESCILESAVNGARILNGKNVTLRYNTFVNCTEAIYCCAESSMIYYNIFRNNDIAIHSMSNMAKMRIYNNVFFDNSVGISNTYTELTIYNNIFYLVNNTDIAINNSQLNLLISDNNIFYPEQEGFIQIANQGYNTLAEYQKNLDLDLNSFSADPEFVDIYHNNFSLDLISPAINKGKIIGLQQDFYGTQVPFGGFPDIGSVEILDNSLQTALASDFRENQANEDLQIFPNPNKGIFSVYIKNDQLSSCLMTISDLSGNIVYRSNFDRNQNFIQHVNISHLYKGVYVVSIESKTSLLSQPIIIN